MTTTITHSSGVIAPEVVHGFQATRDARSIVHTILGREDPDITFRPASLRKGTLTLVFPTGAAASAAEAILVTGQVFTIQDSTVAEVGMSFVVADGSVTRSLDGGTRVVWTVAVPFQEVAP